MQHELIATVRLSIIITLLNLTIPSIGIAHVIIVPDDYSTIQMGIDMAGERDNVSVKYDIYFESIDIDKSILLTRHGTQKPFITSSVGATITIENAQAVVSGFDVQTSHPYGTGILISNTKSVKIEDCTLSKLFTGICVIQSAVNMERCLFYDNDMGIYFSDNGVVSQVMNCTLCSNQTGIHALSQNIKITNSILWNNSNADIVGSPTVTYSCIEDGYTGTGNIDDDTLFDDAPNGDFKLLWDKEVFSPCIDTGDPVMDWDDDDTPPDMGAIPTFAHYYFKDDYDYEAYDNIDWISFPVLNRITDDWMNAIHVLEQQLLIDDDQFFGNDSLDHVLYQNNYAVWFSNGWQTNLTNGEFDTKQGYKFVLKEGCDYMPFQGISGSWLDPSTPIQLYPEQENWIGCFLIEPEYFDDAFESIEDEWLTISSEHWYAQRGSRVTNYTANPGELYIITVDTLCQLVWGDSLGSKGVTPFIKEKTEYFTYNETIDYMAIDIDTVYSNIPVAEIAVYCDDECLGATKVYDNQYPVQILAYTFEGTNGGSGELEFRFYYEEGKGFSKSIPYITYNSNTHIFYQQSLYYKRKGYAKVKLNTKESTAIQNLTLLQNYPNPVRSNITTIHFMPEQNAEHTELNIYNIRGQLIRTIDCDDIMSSGTKDLHYSIIWDCKDKKGKDVTNGI